MPRRGARNYAVESFIHGEARDTLSRLVDRLPGRLACDPDFLHAIAVARATSEGAMRDQLGVYRVIADALQERVSVGKHPWVRDVTISNSTFGNRFVQIAAPHLGAPSRAIRRDRGLCQNCCQCRQRLPELSR